MNGSHIIHKVYLVTDPPAKRQKQSFHEAIEALIEKKDKPKKKPAKPKVIHAYNPNNGKVGWKILNETTGRYKWTYEKPDYD